MTASALLDQAQLAARAGLRPTRLRHLDDAGLLPAARRDGEAAR